MFFKLNKHLHDFTIEDFQEFANTVVASPEIKLLYFLWACLICFYPFDDFGFENNFLIIGLHNNMLILSILALLSTWFLILKIKHQKTFSEYCYCYIVLPNLMLFCWVCLFLYNYIICESLNQMILLALWSTLFLSFLISLTVFIYREYLIYITAAEDSRYTSYNRQALKNLLSNTFIFFFMRAWILNFFLKNFYLSLFVY